MRSKMLAICTNVRQASVETGVVQGLVFAHAPNISKPAEAAEATAHIIDMG